MTTVTESPAFSPISSALRRVITLSTSLSPTCTTLFTPGLAGLVLGEFQSAQPPEQKLTERETEVLKMVAKGLSYRQIAERLVLSHRTVQNHVQNTLRKLQMHNRVELTRYAIEQGLDDD